MRCHLFHMSVIIVTVRIKIMQFKINTKIKIGAFLCFFYFQTCFFLLQYEVLYDVYFSGSDVMTLELIGKEMCIRECVFHSFCQGVNYRRHKLECQLLYKTFPENLHREMGTIYVHSIASVQVNDYCLNSRCPALHRCVNGKVSHICIQTECAVDVKNGNLSTSVMAVGTAVNFSCLEGYVRRIGEEITCLSSGKVHRPGGLACYKKEGNWTIAFKSQSDTGIATYDVYVETGLRQELNKSFLNVCTELKKRSNCSIPYRTGLIDDWELLGITQVRFLIIINSTLTREVIFNGTNSTMMNWFDKSRLVSSTWSDLDTRNNYNIFSISGVQDGNVVRHWVISHYFDGCPRDYGWFSTSINPTPGCEYDRMASPAYITCPGKSRCLVQRDAVNADAFAIMIKAENLV